MIKLIIILLGLLLIPVYAGDKAQTFGLAYYFQIFGSLILVLGIVFFASKLLKFKVRKKSTGLSRIVDFLAIEPQVSVYKLLIDGEHYVVGVGNKQIVLLNNNSQTSSVDFAKVLEEEADKT